MVFKTTCVDTEYHYVKALFSSREGHFSLRWIRGILAIRRRGLCVSSERYIGELGVRCLSTIGRGQDSAATASRRGSERSVRATIMARGCGKGFAVGGSVGFRKGDMRTSIYRVVGATSRGNF